MKFYKEKIMNMYPDSGKIALFISLLALGLMVGNNNQPCLSAQSTCSVGSDNEFTENIKIKGGTSYATTLDGSGILADRTLTLPDSDLDLNNVIVAGGLSSSKSVSTDGSGDLTTNDVYPLTLSASKSISTDVSGNLETNDVYPLTLTADKLLVSDGSGNLTTSDLVPMSFTASSVVITDVSGNLTDGTVDLDQLTPGGASTNDEIRMGSGGDWEYFTPAGGGAYTLIDSGTIIANPTSSDEVFTCWYGNTLDSTKKYKLIFDGGTGLNIGATGYIPSYVPIEGDCTLGKNEWETNSYYANAQAHVGTRANAFYESYHNRCYTIQGGDSNYSASLAGNIQGHIQFSAVDNGNDYGLWSEYKMSAVTTDGSGVMQFPGIQWSTGSCLVWTQSYTNPFSDITGFMHYFEGGFPAPLTRKWALYEIDY